MCSVSFFSKSHFKKVIICLTYPSNYPSHHVLIELKSKTIGGKLLDGLVKVSEEEAKKHEGKPHCLKVIGFIDQFLDDNPLVCCSDEISAIRALVDTEAGDKFKLSQKTSSVTIAVFKDEYYFKAKIVVPNDYPLKQIRYRVCIYPNVLRFQASLYLFSIDSADSNFPRVFNLWFVENGREVARRCVDPPLRRHPKDPPFEPRPSLLRALKFIVQNVKRYPDEMCGQCGRRCFPANPTEAVHNENAAAHVERVYCSHCYHHDCLILYMKTPPFEGD